MNAKRTTALITAGVVSAVPLSVVLAGAANADGIEKERHGTVAGARYEFNVEKERRGYDVDVDLDGIRKASSWKVVVKHDGKTILKQTKRAHRDDDGGYEVDFRDVRSGDTPGSDTFKMKVSKVGGGSSARTIAFG